jgi:hypothetical protein
MGRNNASEPAFWAEDLALTKSEVVRGERIPAREIHAELLAALPDLDPEPVKAPALQRRSGL